MPSITLDYINEALESKYGPFVVKGIPGGDATLLAAMRLDDKKLAQVTEQQQILTTSLDPAVQVEAMKQIIRLAARTAADANRLLKALGGDRAKLLIVIDEYGKASQVDSGEAAPSPS